VSQCMFVIWLGAFTSLAVAMFSSQSSQLTSVGSAAGVLASIATRSLPWSPSASDVDTGWHIFTAVFCITAVASMSAYVSQSHTDYFSLTCCCLLQHFNQELIHIATRLVVVVLLLLG